MTESPSNSTQEEQIPESAIIDRDIAELMAYAGKPYLEMAKLARENGMSEGVIQAAIGLGDKAEDDKEHLIDKQLDNLKGALQATARELSEPSDRSVSILSFDTEDPGNDPEVYKLSKDRLYGFLGITGGQAWQKVGNRSGSGYELLTKSPLGLFVTEVHPHSSIPNETINVSHRKRT
jgi:hypothetical protein